MERTRVGYYLTHSHHFTSKVLANLVDRRFLGLIDSRARACVVSWVGGEVVGWVGGGVGE